ncbi:MAG: T9SS type A sorting domain-containing protein [Flavobacteriales bacterium]|nr:T9SS type A sorting domain-containing protein [Flavobacteriales bacterium]MCB9365056.1 T9SS type A sorting domain-containing protein [Flavobacteriales bacterium]
MKKMNHILNFKNSIVLLFLLTATILKAQPPVASFNYFDVCVSEAANFTDVSTDTPDTWTWYFQGGSPSTSTNQYPAGVTYFSPGVYEVKLVVSNIYGADSITQYINVYDMPMMNLNITDVTCYGMADGTVEANVIGGTMPYNYMWNTAPIQTTQLATMLIPGNYTATVTDANGCVVVGNATVNQPPELLVSLSNESICPGDTGSLTAFPSGGTVPYNYSWNDPLTSTTAVMTDFPTATTNYEVTVIDANGCTINENADIITFSSPVVSFTTTDVSCNSMADGSVSANVAGGTSPFSYSWSPTGGTNAIATNLIAGNYAATVTDANGCTVIGSATITQPPMLAISISNETICPGDAGTLAAFSSGGTPPYSYYWNDPLSTTTDVMTDFPVVTTTYAITVTDFNGCTSVDNADIIVYSAPSFNINDTTICEGGTVSFSPTISGGTPAYSFLWWPGGETTLTLADSPSGNTSYALEVTDANSCRTVDTALVTVNSNPIANGSFMSLCEDTLGQAEFDLTLLNSSVNGGTGNTVSWYEDPGLTQYISGASAFVTGSTTLYVDVESPELCHSYASVQLNVKDSTTNVIKGIVNFQSSPITSGNVRLIRKNGMSPQDMELIQIKPVNGAGEYEFNDVPKGTYIVKAFGDTLLYDNIPTYGGDVVGWASATEYSILSTCDDTVSVGIELIVEPTNSGMGSVSGRLIEDDGTTNKAPGEPISDIDITVEQSPGGTIMSATKTDIDGYFNFHGLPAGDYIIYADMLGYTTTPQVITFDGSSMNQDVILCSNDTLTLIDLCSSVVTAVSSLPNSSNQFNIYPNPATDLLTIKFDDNEPVSVAVIDAQGRVVVKKDNVRSNSQIDVTVLSNGIYQLKIVGINSYVIKKLLIQR